MKRFTTLLTSAALLLAISASAQKIVTIDTSNSGIPSNNVTALKFDKSGNLWVGTSDAGLGMFDGNNWTYFNLANTPNLGSNHISDIQQHTTGDLWITTLAGISHKSGGGWTLYDTSMLRSPAKTAIVQSDYEAVIRFDSKGNIYTKGQYLYKFNGGTWSIEDSLTSNSILRYANGFVIDHNDDIWLGNAYKFDGNNWILNSSIGISIYSAIDIDNDGNLAVIRLRNYAGTIDINYLTLYDSTGNLIDEYNIDTKNSTDPTTLGGYIPIIKNDQINNKIWIATVGQKLLYSNRSIRWVDKNTNQFMIDSTLLEAVENLYVRSFEFDTKGNTWIGVNPGDGNGRYYRQSGVPTASGQKAAVGGIVIYNEDGVDLNNFPIGIKKQTVLSSHFKIFPNPATSHLNLITDKIVEEGTISIMDMKGAIVVEEKMPSYAGRFSLPLNVILLPGTYFLNISDKNGRSLHTERFVMLPVQQ